MRRYFFVMASASLMYAADAVAGQPGAISRATIVIRASIGVRLDIDRPGLLDPSRELFCIRTNSPVKAYTLAIAEGRSAAWIANRNASVASLTPDQVHEFTSPMGPCTAETAAQLIMRPSRTADDQLLLIVGPL